MHDSFAHILERDLLQCSRQSIKPTHWLRDNKPFAGILFDATQRRTIVRTDIDIQLFDNDRNRSDGIQSGWRVIYNIQAFHYMQVAKFIDLLTQKLNCGKIKWTIVHTIIVLVQPVYTFCVFSQNNIVK